MLNVTLDGVFVSNVSIFATICFTDFMHLGSILLAVAQRNNVATGMPVHMVNGM